MNYHERNYFISKHMKTLALSIRRKGCTGAFCYFLSELFSMPVCSCGSMLFCKMLTAGNNAGQTQELWGSGRSWVAGCAVTWPALGQYWPRGPAGEGWWSNCRGSAGPNVATTLCLQLLLTTASHPVTRFTITVAFLLLAMTRGPGGWSDSDLSTVGVGFVLRVWVQALGRMQWFSGEK